MDPRIEQAIEALVGVLADESIPLEDRSDAFHGAKTRLEVLEDIIQRKLRVAEAKLTADQRLKEGDSQYGVHLRHCYPIGGVDGYSAGCKYGADDFCPAALFEDPWQVYLEWEKKVDG